MIKNILKISEITRLRLSDRLLFSKFFSESSMKYMSSWLYLLRAAHCGDGSLGYKFLGKELIAVIGYRHRIIYITPILDETQGFKLEQLCKKIYSLTNCQIIIKKFPLQLYKYVESFKKGQNISSDLFEDDAFVETVVDLRRLFINSYGVVNPIARSFIRNIKRFEKLGLSYEIVDDIKLIPQEKIVQFLKNDPEKYYSYAPLVRYLYQHGKDIRYKIMVFLVDGKVEGFYVSEVFLSNNAGLYCAVTSKNRQGITEWMDYIFFKKLLFMGVNILYLGGSETEGVKKYVDKLLPSKPDYIVNAVWYDNSVISIKRQEVMMANVDL